ncbi:MAG: DUF4867 family protein [Clostridiales bacterium]|jgi:hypothetical protein|nr:DUF4867 family protein [Clostridiales bacterium]
MTLKNISDESFKAYGQMLTGYDFTGLLKALAETDCPGEGTVYTASEPLLEGTNVYDELRDRQFGGMPIQIGYCNGVNSVLNCLEYHRDSEVIIAGTDCVLLLALRSDIRDWLLDTQNVRGFFLPAGHGVELYASAMHYAPLGATPRAKFRAAIVLPLGSNTDKPKINIGSREDAFLSARNKWLFAHPDSPEAKAGAVAGLTGENIRLE